MLKVTSPTSFGIKGFTDKVIDEAEGLEKHFRMVDKSQFHPSLDSSI